MLESLNLRHFEGRSTVNASPSEVFAALDDHALLSAHMEKSSWLMLGSRMEIHLDEERGRKIGSRIQLDGRILGIPLTVEEVITERVPPTRKVWETIGPPNLFVIGSYRMGFEILPTATPTPLRIFIDYDLPNGPQRLLGHLLGAAYARWCVRRMLRDAVAHFANQRISKPNRLSASTAHPGARCPARGAAATKRGFRFRVNGPLKRITCDSFAGRPFHRDWIAL